MTINYARESVIDFTKPFMNLGISILFKVRIIDIMEILADIRAIIGATIIYPRGEVEHLSAYYYLFIY